MVSRTPVFQTNVASSKSRVALVTAGCGCGKTVAAWLWAAQQCPGQRVFFSYPTTGTASEGFLGYLFDHNTRTSRPGADLFHSRAQVDFEVILDVNETDDEKADAVVEEQLRIYSLKSWSTPNCLLYGRYSSGHHARESSAWALCLARIGAIGFCIRRDSCLRRQAIWLSASVSQRLARRKNYVDDRKLADPETGCNSTGAGRRRTGERNCDRRNSNGYRVITVNRPLMLMRP